MKNRPLALSNVAGGGPCVCSNLVRPPWPDPPLWSLFSRVDNGLGVEKVEETFCSRREYGIPKLL